jgi:hypothetical protein
MSSKGRYGDTMLVHMAPSEVSGLHALARAHGEKLTINPETGLPEAFKLKSLLPMILGAALGPAGFGLSAMMSAGVVGAGYGLAKGSLKEGLLAGLGAYGGAGLAGSLASAGVSEAAAQEAFKSQAAEQAAANATATGTAAGTSATEAMLGAPTTTTASTTGAAGAAEAASAQQQALMSAGATPVEIATTTQMPVAEQIATAGFQSAAPPTGLEALKRGAQSIYDKGTFGEFAKANKNALYAAGASALMAPEDEEGLPETKRDPGYIRPARYDWRTGKYEYFEPVDASKWGTRNLSEYTNARDPNARTPIGRKAGGLMALANGGAVAFAEGGMTEEQLASINAYLQTNPSAEALAAAQAQYGVSSADLERARAYGNVGSAPGSNVAGAPAGPVVGGGGYSDFTPSGGTTEQGYSQNYSPEQMVAMRGTFLQNQSNPQKMMELMNQYGVNVKDLSLAMGGSEKGYQNIFLQGGADPSFGGMSDYKATTNDKAYLDNMLKQPNPLGQGTLADVYKKQGIDPYTDPRVLTQAREENERLARRNLMRTGAGADPVPGPGGGGGGTTPGPTTPGPTTPGPTNPRPPVPVTPRPEDVMTGGSLQAFQYLMGQGPYPTNPYLPAGTPIAKPIYETPGYEALKPKPSASLYSTNPSVKPTGNPGTGNEWVWKEDQKKWVSQKIGASGSTTTPTPDPTPNDGGGPGAANGGLMPRRMALGGLGALAGGGEASQYNLGGYSDGGRLLKGPGDGVSDDIPATIGNKQPARLADGEFVVPARIVSELGNGSTEAGARKLYAMMDRVQRARGKTTGKNRVAANSRADKHLPA